MHWSNLCQINISAHKNHFKVSIINISVLDLLWKCLALWTNTRCRIFNHVSIKATIGRSLTITVEEKPYCTSVSMTCWQSHRDYRVFWKQPPLSYWPKKFLLFTSWSTEKKLMLKEGYWSTSSNVLATYLYIT